MLLYDNWTKSSFLNFFKHLWLHDSWDKSSFQRVRCGSIFYCTFFLRLSQPDIFEYFATSCNRKMIREDQESGKSQCGTWWGQTGGSSVQML